MSASILANLAQGGAAFGAFLKLKDKKMKSVALSTSFSAIMGINEPAMFGITLKYKRPFVAAMIGAAVGALYAALTGVEFVGMAGVGITGILGVVPQFLVHMVIASVITLVVSALLTVLFGIQEEEGNTQAKPQSAAKIKNTADQFILSPMKGEVIDIACVKDPAFSNEVIGKGVVIIPSEGKVYSPVNGTVTALFQTHHAIGLTSDAKEEILIHVGLDTVQLKGNYFTPAVKQGDRVQQGELLLTFDIDAIKAAGYDVTTPVVITNKNDYMDVFAINQSALVNVADKLLAVINK